MVKRAIEAVREYGNRTVKVKWVVPAYLLIAAIGFGLLAAAKTYADDKARQSLDAVVAAQYEADITTFESCLRRVESRAEIRGMFAASFDAIEAVNGGPSRALTAARVRLDERYPALPLASCEPPPQRD